VEKIAEVFLKRLSRISFGASGTSLMPKFSIELSREALKEGRDTQLETAIEVAKR
jgi:hypothetical protein